MYNIYSYVATYVAIATKISQQYSSQRQCTSDALIPIPITVLVVFLAVSVRLQMSNAN